MAAPDSLAAARNPEGVVVERDCGSRSFGLLGEDDPFGGGVVGGSHPGRGLGDLRQDGVDRVAGQDVDRDPVDAERPACD